MESRLYKDVQESINTVDDLIELLDEKRKEGLINKSEIDFREAALTKARNILIIEQMGW